MEHTICREPVRLFDRKQLAAYTVAMETMITIDAEILNKAMKAADGQTQRQLVENALRLFTLQNKQGIARKYRGKMQWEGNLDELRSTKWSL